MPVSRLVLICLALGGVLACDREPPPGDAVSVGLLLSYTGYLAANSVNSERALRMAFEAANAAGGIGGRPLRLLARDTRSDPRKVGVPARELLDAGVALVIGPDTTDLIANLGPLFIDRTVILPSSNTSSDVEWRRPSWFVMGAGTTRIACELVAQLRGDGRTNPLLLVNPTGQNNALSWDLGLTYGMPKLVFPTDLAADSESLRMISRSVLDRDAIVLAAFPTSASALVYALTATGELGDPTRWYLSPTLHTPAFLESIPKGGMNGARGVSTGTVGGAGAFRTAFAERWQDVPLDDAYPFYDAGAIAVFALARAMSREGAIPDTNRLAPHVLEVTRAGGQPIQWHELERGLALLGQGQEIEYFGLTGLIQFDVSGQTPTATTKWWTVGEDGFEDIPRAGACQ